MRLPWSPRAASTIPSQQIFFLTAFNSMTRSVEPLQLLPLAPLPRVVNWYTCGPTVYDVAHIGHARTYVALDPLRRIVERHVGAAGGSVCFAMGVTDIDDKIVERAATLGVAASDLAARYEVAFAADMAALGVAPPTATLRVTEHMDAIIDMVRDIVDGGFGYVVPGDGVYFDTRALGGRYGAHLAPEWVRRDDVGAEDAVSHSNSGSRSGDSEEMPAVEVLEGAVAHPPTLSLPLGPSAVKKRNPRDFALWKCDPKATTLTVAESPAALWGHPVITADTVAAQAPAVQPLPAPPAPLWHSPWGVGRPGWHIECSAMATRLFGPTLTLHSGGIDLAFPHHCNEVAQCEAAALARRRLEVGGSAGGADET